MDIFICINVAQRIQRDLQQVLFHSQVRSISIFTVYVVLYFRGSKLIRQITDKQFHGQVKHVPLLFHVYFMTN